jgi:DNA helicase IV
MLQDDYLLIETSYDETDKLKEEIQSLNNKIERIIKTNKELEDLTSSLIEEKFKLEEDIRNKDNDLLQEKTKNFYSVIAYLTVIVSIVIINLV